ncbi:UNVERIFIED_ORG: hypothetical protein M2402_004260 [Rahnella aquatilis]
MGWSYPDCGQKFDLFNKAVKTDRTILRGTYAEIVQPRENKGSDND